MICLHLKLEINAAMQQAQQGTGSTRNKTEEVQIRNSNPARLTEEDIDEMEVDTNESKKGSKRDKKKSKQLNGNTENNNNANINNSHNKKERKQVECSEHEDEMDCDSRMEHEPQKKNSKVGHKKYCVCASLVYLLLYTLGTILLVSWSCSSFELIWNLCIAMLFHKQNKFA